MDDPNRCKWCGATEDIHRVEYPPCITVTECTDKKSCNERWLTGAPTS